MPYTDAIGVWQELNFTPVTVTNDWVILPINCNNGSLFRFTFDTNWQDWEDVKGGFRSFGLFRFHYHDDSGNFNWVEKSKAIYPKQEQLLMSLPSLPEIKDNPWTIRKMAVKRIKQRFPIPDNLSNPIVWGNQTTPLLDWSLYVEYLI